MSTLVPVRLLGNVVKTFTPQPTQMEWTSVNYWRGELYPLMNWCGERNAVKILWLCVCSDLQELPVCQAEDDAVVIECVCVFLFTYIRFLFFSNIFFLFREISENTHR